MATFRRPKELKVLEPFLTGNCIQTTCFKIETNEISTTGIATGSAAINKFGNSESFFSTIVFNSLVDAPDASRIGRSYFSSNDLARYITNQAGKITAAKPAIIATPKSNFRPSAIINGPGVGGTIECVMAPAPAIAITKSV